MQFSKTAKTAIKSFEFKRPKQFTVNREQLEDWSVLARNDRILLWGIILWLGSQLLSLVCIALFFPKLPTEIPLYYSRPWGSQQLAGKIFIFLLPAGVVVFGTVNQLLAIISYKKEKIVSYIFSIATIFVSILSTLAILNIIHLLT